MGSDMPIPYECDCGERFNFRDSAAGLKTRCRSCGKVFDVPGAYAVDGLGHDEAIAPPWTPAPPPVEIDNTPRLSAAERARLARVRRPFWRDALASFAIFTDPSNAAVLVGSVVIAFFIDPPFDFPYYSVISWLLFGLLSAFLMDITRTVANGEDELPILEYSGDLYEGIILPILMFYGAVMVSAIPVYSVMLADRIVGLDPRVAQIAYPLASGIGVLLAPAALLTVAIGGLSALVRVDLMLVLIARTFVPYIAIVALCAAAVSIDYVLLVKPTDIWAWMCRSFKDEVVATLFASIVAMYINIVTARLIGLHYRHFSHRFPWSAG